MARQFTTFSVADILGHGDEEEASSQPQDQTPYHRTEQREAAIAKSGRGAVHQMLPPMPAALAPTTPMHLLLYDQQLSPLTATTGVGVEVEQSDMPAQRNGKRSATKRGRISSEEEDSSYKPEEEEDDDVFLAPRSLNSSRRTSSAPARNRQSPLAGLSVPARDLNSAGETPSPPAETSNVTPPNPPAAGAGTTTASQKEPLDEDEAPRKKRVRTAFSRDQLHTLERHFRKNAYPDNHLLRVINSETNINIPKVQVWFQNRRAKARKWGQVLPEPSSNSALYRGAPPSSVETSRYLPPLQPSSTQSTTGTTSPPTHPPPSSSLLVPPFVTATPYQGFHPPPLYPLRPGFPLLQPTLPYPLPYPLYPTMNPSLLAPQGPLRATITNEINN